VDKSKKPKPSSLSFFLFFGGGEVEGRQSVPFKNKIIQQQHPPVQPQTEHIFYDISSVPISYKDNDAESLFTAINPSTIMMSFTDQLSKLSSTLTICYCYDLIDCI